MYATFKKISSGKSFKSVKLMKNKLTIFAIFLLFLGVVYLINLLTPFSYNESKLEIITPEERIVWPMRKDGTIPIHTPDGQLIVVISHGQAYISESSCPDKICVKSGKIKQNGQTIICAPNRVMLRIVQQKIRADGAILSY